MKKIILITAAIVLNGINLYSQSKPVSLFDGKSFTGWDGDTLHTWHIQNNTITGGSLKENVPHNEFLCTTSSYEDFELTLDFKLVGTGFVNAGVQFHSKRLQNPPFEMEGYQADLGDGYWASLYDESRRNVTIVKPDSLLIAKILKPGEWNKYKVQSKGRRIRIWLNDVQTVDYTEPDEKINHSGLVALQVHGGGKTEVSYRNINIIKL
ncbi:MAG: DUF1080 domain-containing protein [Bacteroidota bacterium]